MVVSQGPWGEAESRQGSVASGTLLRVENKLPYRLLPACSFCFFWGGGQCLSLGTCSYKEICKYTKMLVIK